MRITTNLSHAVFAASLIALGILGLITADFASVWQAVPKSVPAREALAYLCAGVSVAAGLGLLWRRTSLVAARVVLVYCLLWLLLLKVPDVIRAPMVEVSWLGCGEIAVLVAGAWVLYAAFARGGFAGGDGGRRGARLLFGLALIPLGLAHLIYAEQTSAMVPAWLPFSHLFWAYLTGATYLAASAAVLLGRYARLAAALTAVQMGGFALLVWVPMVAAAAGKDASFQWAGLLISMFLAAGAWVVADSCAGMKR